VLARGDQVEGSEMGWAVGIAHPTKPKRRLTGVWLGDMALATSGSGKQFFHHKGKRFGHVIDPRTGYPTGDLLSLTVMMKSAADADAAATGLFVAGSREIDALSNEDWMGDLVLVRGSDRQDSVELESRGDVLWAEEEQGEGVSRPSEE
jgi:thiamine biosynthesis lipoprotein